MSETFGPDLTGPIYRKLKEEAINRAWEGEELPRLRRRTFFPIWKSLNDALNECEEKLKEKP